jgi:hypothetical protein
MVAYTIDAEAYATACLHALAHPSCAVSGLLLAPAAEPTRLSHAAPLFHSGHGLAPMQELALATVAAHAATQGLVLAAVYAANVRAVDCVPHRAAQALAEALSDGCPTACVLLVRGAGCGARGKVASRCGGRLFVHSAAQVDAAKLAAAGGSAPQMALQARRHWTVSKQPLTRDSRSCTPCKGAPGAPTCRAPGTAGCRTTSHWSLIRPFFAALRSPRRLGCRCWVSARGGQRGWWISRTTWRTLAGAETRNAQSRLRLTLEGRDWLNPGLFK